MGSKQTTECKAIKKLCSISQRRENWNEKKIALATFSTRFRFLSRNPKIVSSEKKSEPTMAEIFFFLNGEKNEISIFLKSGPLSLSLSLSLSLIIRFLA